jgi:hypothetical protein
MRSGLARPLGLSPDHAGRKLQREFPSVPLLFLASSTSPKSSFHLFTMPGQRISPKLDRNVHFVNADNDEIGGTWQNGSLTWAEMSEWMQIVFELPLDKYAPFPCLEDGDPNDPVG